MNSTQSGHSQPSIIEDDAGTLDEHCQVLVTHNKFPLCMFDLPFIHSLFVHITCMFTDTAVICHPWIYCIL